MNVAEHTSAEDLGLLVKETQTLLHQRMSEALRPLGLSVPQYACLQALHDTPGITGSELARRVFVSRQSMNVLLQGLEGRGLVERSDRPGPRRERATTISAAATETLALGRAAVSDVAARMVGGLEQEDRDRLRTLLAACSDALLHEER
ncbi:MarR family winged helix-turn-helix transcriptional regulator [Promicromonospora sp. NFX87]|uniref:MarR family winged helix-turn-helix transcriptional regulator n=1 Tax=Promicromonospora sp. NFX87 TaxID=3402691 RepID=UPI003AFB11A7